MYQAASSDLSIHVVAFNASDLTKDCGSEYFPMELGFISATEGVVKLRIFASSLH